MVPTSTIYNKLENIQLFYSLVLQKQQYDQDPKTKNLMNNTSAIQNFMSQTAPQKKKSFYQSIITLRTNLPPDDITHVPETHRHKFVKNLKVTWTQKIAISILKIKRYFMILFFCIVFQILIFYNDMTYNAITNLNDRLSFTRFYLVEVNILPRTYGYRLFSKEGEILTSEAQSIINYRQQTLKNLYSYFDELNKADSLYVSSHIENALALLTKNMTEILDPSTLGAAWFISKLQLEEFENLEIHQELMSAANKFANNFNDYYNEIFPIIEKGLKYTIIANINNCDYLLKSSNSEGYENQTEFRMKIERINHKLIPVIYLGLDMIFEELFQTLINSTMVYLVLLLITLAALATTVGFVLVKFYLFLKKDASEEAYIENNMLNLIDAVTLEDMEENFSKATSQINFFRLVF